MDRLHITFYYNNDSPMNITCEASALARYLERYAQSANCIGYTVMKVNVPVAAALASQRRMRL